MFKFTIRELLLLTLVAAMGVGWWVDRSRLASRERALISSQKLSEGLFESLRQVVEHDGYKVVWNDNDQSMTILRPGDL
jgi:hypothetical protein